MSFEHRNAIREYILSLGKEDGSILHVISDEPHEFQYKMVVIIAHGEEHRPVYVCKFIQEIIDKVEAQFGNYFELKYFSGDTFILEV